MGSDTRRRDADDTVSIVEKRHRRRRSHTAATQRATGVYPGARPSGLLPRAAKVGRMSSVDSAVLESAKVAIRPIADRFALTEALEQHRSHRWRHSLPRLPVLSHDDVSAIPFLVGITGIEEYQHRARLRAGDGDLFAAGTPQTDGYEDYCRTHLGLGSAEFIHAEPEEGPLAVASACSHGASLERIVATARAGNGLIIHPYMGIETVWTLANRVAQQSGQPTTVLAPPPPVTWIANDKAAFGEVVSRVLGADWLVETYETHEPSDLAKHLVDLASRHARVALKRLRCASAMGNAVFEASELKQLAPADVQSIVDSFLSRTEWQGDEEVQAVAWEETDLSPSTQLWIPPDGMGPPRLDGTYEQILEGEHGVFLGSRPSTLPEPINQALGEASLRVAAALQALGYVGRCSFDFLVVGDPDSDFELHFTECNGRWGGTSTPMSLLDRLIDGPRPPYRAQDFVRAGLVGASFGDVLAAVGDELYDPTSRRGRLVLYNVGPLAETGKIDVIALGRTQEEAEEMMEVRLPALLGV